ncbi:MAG: hypothetical protein QGI09_09335, partial [Dehalococcoidia bacterium]|nr:hypothetical protein [Dehalococcoidia bacterium]
MSTTLRRSKRAALPFLLLLVVAVSRGGFAEAQTPATPTPPRVSEAAKSQSVILDSSIHTLETVSFRGKQYHVVEYKNRLSFASGLGVISGDGIAITDEATVRSIFGLISWKDAASRITESDITTFEGILRISKEIDDAV